MEKQISENKAKETRKRVFVTQARVIPEAERDTLTETEKNYEGSCKSQGVWLELFCPDNACFTEEERVNIPVFCDDPSAGKKLWLKLFCPEGSCEVNEASKLP